MRRHNGIFLSRPRKRQMNAWISSPLPYALFQIWRKGLASSNVVASPPQHPPIGVAQLLTRILSTLWERICSSADPEVRGAI